MNSNFSISIGILAVVAAIGYLLFSLRTRDTHARIRSIAYFSLSLFLLIQLSIPKLRGDGEVVDFAKLLQTPPFANATIFSYRCYPQILPPYLGRTISVAQFTGELEFGINHLSPDVRNQRFPDLDQFRKTWESDQPVVVITPPEKLPHWVEDGLSPGSIIRKGQRYVLLVNRPMNAILKSKRTISHP